MRKEVIKVGGMSCGHCVATIEGSLNNLEGVHQVKVSLEGGTVEVEFDAASRSLASLKEVLDDVGYDVER